MYQGVEHGSLQVDKVFHKCAHSMCAGEELKDSRSRDTLQVTIVVNNADISTADAQTEARATFATSFATAVANTLDVGSVDIAIDAVKAAPGTGTLRRWLQELSAAGADTLVSFTITIDAELATSLTARINMLRNTTGSTIAVGNGVIALTSTFTEPTIVPHAGPAGIQCREGHDPTSPLCHVCLDGALLQPLSYSTTRAPSC
jgi:hypothetical protein